MEVVPCIVRAKVSPTAIEYMSRETILFSESYLGKKFPDTHASAYILLTFDATLPPRWTGSWRPWRSYVWSMGHRMHTL